MSEIRTVHSLIQEHARISVELLDRLGNVPSNPCPQNSDEHKMWAAEFYTHGIARGIDALAK